jgi:ribosome-binding factor A
MNESLRQKRIASLVQEILSAQIIPLMQDSESGLVTVTRVEISKDLKTAHIYVSVFGKADPAPALLQLESLQQSLRKAIASRSKLKYNPKLIFSLDPQVRHESRIDELLNDIKDHGR